MISGLKIISFVIVGISVLIVSLSGVTKAQNASCSVSESVCGAEQLLIFGDKLASLPEPTINDPNWMKPKIIFTYDIKTRGNVDANIQEFKSQVGETLNDPRGWSQLGVEFRAVDSGGDFSLYLSEASSMTSFSVTGCSVLWSCRVGTSVIINQDRWLGATTTWNGAGGSLRDYRHMVINHEVGHWLGHDHLNCSGAGQPAPLMQQQSIDLQGCTFNAWPLAGELWSSRL